MRAPIMEGPDVSGVKASNEVTNLDWDSDYWTKGMFQVKLTELRVYKDWHTSIN